MNMQPNRKIDAKYIEYIFLAVFPILALYKFVPLLNVGSFILLCIILINIKKQNFYSKFNVQLLITMILLMFINIITGIFKYIDVTNSLNNTADMLVFTVIAVFLCTPGYLDKEKLYNACKLVGIVATIFIFYQFIEYYFFHSVVMGQLPFLTPVEAQFGSIGYGRPTSFFYEPAHYAIYILPIYAVSLIKKEFIFSSILLLGLVLSTSSTGIIIALIIPVLVLFKGNEKPGLRNLLMLVLGFLLLLALANYYQGVFDKITMAGLTNNIRVFGTIDYFKYFNAPDWLFGLGFNRLSEYLSYYGYPDTRNYANAYFFSVLSFGIVGGCLWIIYNITLFKKTAIEYRSLFYILIMISFTDQILFNRNLLYLLMWIYAVAVPRNDWSTIEADSSAQSRYQSLKTVTSSRSTELGGQNNYFRQEVPNGNERGR